MIDIDDRWLDVALEEALGVATLPTIEEVLTSRQLARPQRSSTPSRLGLVAVAAVLLLASAALYLWLPSPVARVDPTAGPIALAQGDPQPRADFPRGAWVTPIGDAHGALVQDDGSRIEIAPGTLLRLPGRPSGSSQIAFGALRVQAGGAAPVDIHTDFAEIRLSNSSRAEISLFSPEAPGVPMIQSLQPWIEGRSLLSPVLTIVLLGGSAQIQTPAGTVSLKQGEAATVAGKTAPEKRLALTAAERERLKSLMSQIDASEADIDFSKPEAAEAGMVRMKSAIDSAAEISQILERKPEGFEAVRTDLWKLPSEPARADVRVRRLGILAMDPDPTTTKRVEQALQDRDDPGTDEIWLALHDRGATTAADALRKRLRDSTRSKESNVLIASALAFNGDATARRHLEVFLRDRQLSEGMPIARLAAAVAMVRLGQPGPWARSARWIQTLVNEALQQGSTATAESWLAHGIFFDEILQKKRTPRFAKLASDLGDLLQSRIENPSKPAEIRSQLEALVKRAADLADELK
ncbi:MAG: hypothetical protein JNJ88_19735 [Planctomycetes bacterium]|nr:hypothetical protein [Planctomycetota bacterium]